MQEKKEQKLLVQFKKVKGVHIKYFEDLMKDPKKRNLTLKQKTKLMNDYFPELNICRVKKGSKIQLQAGLLISPQRCGSVFNVPQTNLFCEEYFSFNYVHYPLELIISMLSEETKIFVLDEVGFGTQHLKRYAYSRIGKPAILEGSKLYKNLSCTATISEDCVECLQFIDGGGTKNETFVSYFKRLQTQLMKKYVFEGSKIRKLVLILDNLSAHKSSLVMNNIDKQVILLFLPPYTPCNNFTSLCYFLRVFSN